MRTLERPWRIEFPSSNILKRSKGFHCPIPQVLILHFKRGPLFLFYFLIVKLHCESLSILFRGKETLGIDFRFYVFCFFISGMKKSGIKRNNLIITHPLIINFLHYIFS